MRPVQRSEPSWRPAEHGRRPPVAATAGSRTGLGRLVAFSPRRPPAALSRRTDHASPFGRREYGSVRRTSACWGHFVIWTDYDGHSGRSGICHRLPSPNRNRHRLPALRLAWPCSPGVGRCGVHARGSPVAPPTRRGRDKPRSWTPRSQPCPRPPSCVRRRLSCSCR